MKAQAASDARQRAIMEPSPMELQMKEVKRQNAERMRAERDRLFETLGPVMP
jgi:hypothetical protein